MTGTGTHQTPIRFSKRLGCNVKKKNKQILKFIYFGILFTYKERKPIVTSKGTFKTSVCGFEADYKRLILKVA